MDIWCYTMTMEGAKMSVVNSSGKHHRTYSVQMHTHDDWELIYCTTGNGVLTFKSGEQLPYVQNDIVAIPPRIYHSNDSSVGFTNIFLTIENASLPFKNPIKFTDNNTQHIYNAFSEAYYYFNSEIDKKDLLLTALADLIVGYLIVSYNQTPYSEWVETLRNNIIKNFSDSSFKLSTALSSLPTSPDYLRKLFTKEIGMSPLDFLTDTRIKLAEKLLKTMKNSEYNVTEIAEMCGYSDSLYFSRVFKKYTGFSPLSYAAKSPAAPKTSTAENE